MAFSIRLTEDERMLAESYAKIHSYSLSEAFKRALFEKIEDEYDIAVAESAYKEYVDSGRKSTPVQDFWRELDETDFVFGSSSAEITKSSSDDDRVRNLFHTLSHAVQNSKSQYKSSIREEEV